MKTYEFYQEQELPISLQKAWDFFSDPNNLIKLTPSEMKMKMLSRESGDGEIHESVVFGFKLFGLIPQQWHSDICEWNPPIGFRDIQTKGPYRYWNHQHLLEETSNGTKVIDKIEYALPLLPFQNLLNRLFILPQLKQLFQYRFETLNRLFPPHA